MDNIVHIISLIILSIGFILIIVYFTMNITKQKINNQGCPQCQPCSTNLNQVYDDRPSITYKKMFENSEVGFGYQDFDVNDNSTTTSFYIKSKI